MTLDRSHISKILVIKLRAIGDVLLSTVVLKNLREAFPQAQIDFLTEKPSREVLEGNSDITSSIIFDNTTQNGAGLVFDIRRRNYDLIIDLFGNPRSALITFFSGAPHRVGYRFKWRRHCYNIIVEPRGGDVHNTEFNLDALRKIQIPVNSTSPNFPLQDIAERYAENFFKTAGLDRQSVVALNPGGGWYTKRWRAQHFARLGDMITAYTNSPVIIIWGPGEQNEAEQIRSSMKSDAILIPKTTLKELASLLKRCLVMVTNDSGPMHIAAAVGTPVVAIFGPTNPELQGPVGEVHEVVQHGELLCLGCNYTRCPIGNPCMEELSAETVFKAFQRVMEKINHRAIQNQPKVSP